MATETIESARTIAFVQQLTSCQGRLHAYIYALIYDADRAWDVLQETNLVLWRKAAEYDSARPFLPWALGVAFNQVRAARQRMARDRLVFHDDATLQIISNDLIARETATKTGDLEIAMEKCIENLEPAHREMIDRHYHQGEALKEIAESMKKKTGAVAVTLHRVRQRLAICVESAMGW